MKQLKTAFGVVLLLILISNIWTISKWNESRGVYDDICYLRQAHLFQRFGISGLDTNIARDDDRYMLRKLQEINFPDPGDPALLPCHTFTAALNKVVLQYPPGTGFVLALFPSGFQVIPLYAAASIAIFGLALLALARAVTRSAVVLAGVFGIVALYLMINPTKASYSVAPTMVVCALTGFLTARLFASAGARRILIAAVVGLLIGLSVNFRLPNLLLAGGYAVFFLVAFLRARNMNTFWQGLSFGIAFLIGMAPTLIANAINAGSPFSTTYGGVDAVPPELNASVLLQYVRDAQFPLLLIAIAWVVALWRSGGRVATRQIVAVIALNLVINLIFFMSHPVFTPYYVIPIVMLSLWTLLFATLDHWAPKLADDFGAPQKASA
ncbi:hypothetical protein [Bradyrhizobium sp. Leo170]|uniref:hypothetical protein n=1 Tax=Bradyrhizobium sp. Leo170 TaxID=1571199 RepID=UPI00102E3763|nr:hypothetical protein [Bradyrhizobium sp. Leo170]TAI61886.1 hypothetical protein CWO89_32700 [Bradyrhizobium sp. Leo170]